MQDQDKQSDDWPRRRKYKPQPIARMLDAYLRGAPGARRARGFAALKLDWADIAGPDFRDLAWPVRVEPGRNGRPGALAVRAAPGAALLLQHEAPRLVERVNAFLGAEAIGRIRISPGPMPRPAKPPRPRPKPLPLDDPRSKDLATRASALGSDRLGEALARLGRAVGANRR